MRSVQPGCLAFNGEPISVDSAELAALPFDVFAEALLDSINEQARLLAYFAVPEGDAFRLFAVLGIAPLGQLRVLSTLSRERFESLAPRCPAVQLFEREIYEQWGLRPEGHPWLKPVRSSRSANPSSEAHDFDGLPPGVCDFYRVEGEEVHEVCVGPVHAGVIEPGQFRFQCHGERVFHLEIALGYQHRGIESAILRSSPKKVMAMMETLAGDTSIGHATAYAQVLEALCGQEPSPRAHALRAIALELERLANHTGDLGALGGDVGFLPTASYCGRIRGDFLNMSALLCGSRFGRGMVRPGGVAFELEPSRAAELEQRLRKTMSDASSAIELLWRTPSVMARFDRCGRVSAEDARALGLVGPAARACGLDLDARADFPMGAYCYAPVPISVWSTGDVLARAHVRWLEMQRSAQFLYEQLAVLGEGPLLQPLGAAKPRQMVVSLVEGWRGEVVHVGITNEDGGWRSYKVVDPSFHNWMGLAMSLRWEAISDFPLCNKSFNLSYCGHDL